MQRTGEANSSYRALFGGSGIIFLGAAFQVVFVFTVDILLSRFLQPTGFGLYNLAKGVVLVASAVSMLGLQLGLSRFIALFLAEQDHARMRGVLHTGFVVVTVSGVLATGLLLCSRTWLQEHVFQQPDVAAVLGGMALAVLFVNWRQYGMACVSGLKKPVIRVLLVNILEPFLAVLISVAALTFFLQITTIVRLYVVMYAVVGVAAVLFALRAFPVPVLQRRDTIYPVGRLLRFSGPLVVTTISGIVIENMDRLMIGWLGAVQDVGVYSVTITWSRLLPAILGVFSFMYLPLASALLSRREGRAEFSQLNNAVAKWSMILAFPLTLVLVTRSSEVLEIFFGPSYLDAARALQIITLGAFLHALTGMTGMNLVAAGRTDLQMVTKLVVIMVNALLNWLLIPWIGIAGAAWGTAIAFFVSNLCNLSFVYRVLRVHPFDPVFIRTLVSLLAAGAAAMLVTRSLAGPVGIAAELAVLGLAWLALAFPLGVFTAQDLHLGRLVVARIRGNGEDGS